MAEGINQRFTIHKAMFPFGFDALELVALMPEGAGSDHETKAGDIQSWETAPLPQIKAEDA